jgi:hypothetical protein
MGWAADDAERAADNHTMRQKLHKDQQDGRIADDTYKAQVRVLDLVDRDLNNKYKEAQTRQLKSGVKGSKSMMSLQDKLNRQTKLSGGLSPSMLKEAENIAAADGFVIEKTDNTNYRSYPKKSADGRRYRESGGRKLYATPKYEYQLKRKPEAAAPPSGGDVTLQDDQGQVIGSYPDLPNRTYVELNGETGTVPNDQLNDFREANPEASVYEIHKK